MTALRVEFTAAEWTQMRTASPLVGRRIEYRTAAPTGPRGVAGGSAVVKEAGSVVSSAATTFDFGTGFDVTESPAGEVNIAIDATELPAASDTAQGPVELATNAETVTGTDTARATTPAGVAAAIAAGIAALINSAPGALDTLDELAAALGDDANFAATVTTALAGKQPIDSDLTAIAALTTTSFGRGLLEVANAAALRTAFSTGTPDGTKFLRDDGVWSAATGGLQSKLGTVPYLLPGVVATGQTNAAIAANYLYFHPIEVYSTLTVSTLAVYVNAGVAGKSVRLGIYNASSAWQPTTVAVQTGAISVATSGLKSDTASVSLAPGRYLTALVSDGTPTLSFLRSGSTAVLGSGTAIASDGYSLGTWAALAFSFGSMTANPGTAATGPNPAGIPVLIGV